MSKRKKQPLEVHELELENAKLKRTISRLRKKLARLEETQGADDAEADIEPVEEPHVKEAVLEDKSSCPSCKGIDLVDFSILNNKYIVCKGCKWRKKNATNS